MLVRHFLNSNFARHKMKRKQWFNILFWLIVPCALSAQSIDPIRMITPMEITESKDSLLRLYSRNKEIPKEYQLQFLAALSFYPELKHTHITFKRTKIKTTLNVRPTFFSLLFHKKENRRYVIRINDDPKRSEVLIHQVPFNAQVGLLGHELAHIIDYQDLGLIGMIKRGLGYMNKDYRKEYENAIDVATIKIGLGWQLLDWSNFIQNHPDIDEDYKKYKKENYLGGNSITEMIKEFF